MAHGKAARQERRTAARAAKAIREHRQTPTPQNYHVWYAHFAGGEPELSTALEARLAAGRELDDGCMLQLYERFLAPCAEARRLREASQRLQQLTDRVGEELAAASRDTRRYQAAVGEMAEEVARASSVTRLKQLFDNLLEETAGVLEMMAGIEARLGESNAEIASLRRDLEQARTEALTDPLTGIANRRRLEGELQEAVEEAERGGPVPALILLDIDHFKAFNDRHGHSVGDRVLQVVARLMAANVKDEDLVARLGGEEFAVLLRDVLEREAVQIAERLRQRIGSCRIRLRNANRFLDRITASLGVGRLQAGETVQDWLERVDAALYLAKREGRDRVVRAGQPGAATGTAVSADAGAAAPAAAMSSHPFPAAEGS